MPIKYLHHFETIFTTSLSVEDKRLLFEQNKDSIIELSFNLASSQLGENAAIDFSDFYERLDSHDYKLMIQKVTEKLLATLPPKRYPQILTALEHSLARLKRRNNFNFSFLSGLLASLTTIEQAEAICNYCVSKKELVETARRKLDIERLETKEKIRKLSPIEETPLERITKEIALATEEKSGKLPRIDTHPPENQEETFTETIKKIDLETEAAILRSIEAKLRQKTQEQEALAISITRLCAKISGAESTVRLAAIEYFHEHIKTPDDFRAVVACLSPSECCLVHNSERTPKLRALITDNKDYQAIINEKISGQDINSIATDDEDNDDRDQTTILKAKPNGRILAAQWTSNTVVSPPSWKKIPSAAELIKFYGLLRLEGCASFFQNSKRWNADSTVDEMKNYITRRPSSRTAEAWKLAEYAINHPEDQNTLVRMVIEARMRSSRFATSTLFGKRYFKASSVMVILSSNDGNVILDKQGEGSIGVVRRKLGFGS